MLGGALSWVAGIAATVIGIILIISIAKEAMSYIKGNGQGSIVGLISKALILIVMIGIVVLAGSGTFNALGESLAGKGNTLLTDIVNNVPIGGGS